MCGIAGVYRYKTNKPVIESEIQSMIDVIQYRGPDGSGIHVDGPFGFGHRRLSILDTHLRSGQPMHDQSGRYTISYNGEVYNFLEIKEQLQTQGMKFNTTSDTEVVLQAMVAKPEKALIDFNGMYAFALWDKQLQELTLVRDRVGIKPLYYVETPQGLAFASEMKSLLQLPEVESVFNPALIDVYMSVGYCPGENTFLQGIKKLPPGHKLTVKNNEIKLEQYWDISYNQAKDLGEAHYLEELDTIFESAVKWQLRSDVPLGVFLSGGVDSSAVVYMMSRLGIKDIKTFSVLWDFGDDFDESVYARSVSKQFKTQHNEFTMQPKDFEAFLPEYIYCMDEPVTEAAAISLYYIARETKKQATVVLSGEGADEVFGGYTIYKYMAFLQKYRMLPAGLRNVLSPIIGSMGPKWKKWVDIASRPLHESYFGVSVYDKLQKDLIYGEHTQQILNRGSAQEIFEPFYDRVKHLPIQNQMQYVDIKTWLLDDLLTKADRMSMAASLELRVPFLDHRFVEFAGRLPEKYRLKNGEPKYLLKKLLEPHLDHKLLYRKKMGFPTPLARLFKGPLQNLVGDTLSSAQFKSRDLFDTQRVSQLFEEHRKGKADHHRVLWQLMVLELWQQKFLG